MCGSKVFTATATWTCDRNIYLLIQFLSPLILHLVAEVLEPFRAALGAKAELRPGQVANSSWGCMETNKPPDSHRQTLELPVSRMFMSLGGGRKPSTSRDPVPTRKLHSKQHSWLCGEMDVTCVLHNFQLPKLRNSHHIPPENTSAQFVVEKEDFFFFKQIICLTLEVRKRNRKSCASYCCAFCCS